MAHNSTFARWWYALKPASWPKTWVPALLGQALGVAHQGTLNVVALAIGLGLCVGLTASIVLLNDWADQRVDAIKRTMFPDGCSPKTIVDGVLSARAVLNGGLLSVALTFGLAALGQQWLPRPLLLTAVFGCAFVFVAYSLPPLSLNYRGGGELLEMIGVGAALPLLQMYVQGGEVTASAFVVVAGYSAFSLGSAVASGLSDEQSDQRGGKTTLVTVFGNGPARVVVEMAVAAGALTWLSGAVMHPELLAWWAVIPPLGLVAWNLLALRAASDTAITNAFAAQARYKRYLHRAIWHGGATMALMLLVQVSVT